MLSAETTWVGSSSQFGDVDASNRDVAANERTFLAWIRTSIALSMLGTLIAQLFRLQNAPSASGVVSLYVLAVPIACVCQGAALITTLTGGHRYWSQQSAMAQGQALASGWEFWLIIGILGSVSDPQPSPLQLIWRDISLTSEKVLIILFVVILVLA